MALWRMAREIRAEAMVQPSLFHRYGGFERISDLVFAFYDRVLTSKRLAPFFANCDMRRLLDHQTKYISSVMGGPTSYSEAHLRDHHAHLRITNADFDELLSHLRMAMEDQAFDPDDIDAVLRKLAQLRRAIVSA